MNFILIGILVALFSYLIGSVPFGLIIVRLTTGKDVRTVESGRTGGTNAMRAAGFWAGLATAMLDLLKATASVWFVKWLPNTTVWMQILAPLCVILGHNYSLFLVERKENGKLQFRGGAGGAPCVGGSVGFWAPSILIILPLGALILYFGGYASIATMSVALISTVLFSVRAWMGVSTWEYATYGLVAFVLLAWSLRPNIQRLQKGNERLVGFRAKRRE
jgi:glycerol-3-phosphate acyltransferase PlsY